MGAGVNLMLQEQMSTSASPLETSIEALEICKFMQILSVPCNYEEAIYVSSRDK